jgi:lipopolysaccharide/colanic/teichoic acid biosynthesis glycosyltransferase
MHLKPADVPRSSERDEALERTVDDVSTLTVEGLEALAPHVSTGTDTGRSAPHRARVKASPPSADLYFESQWSPPEHSRWHCRVKRLLDIGVSAAALLLLSPLLVLTALIIKLTDFGPVLYVQTRVGEGGRHFRFFKFRTMIRNAESLQSNLVDCNHFRGDITFKMTHDPRVTRVGRWLRRTSLDELPQFWHVLTGDMTLVGPRPAVPDEVAAYSEFEMRRISVRPGLTCYWQVCGRSDLPFERQVELDLEYIENASLLLDLTLMIRTVPALIFMRGAY